MKIVKWTGVALLVVLLLGIGLGLHTWIGRPLQLDWFYTRVFARYALQDPQLLTSLHMVERFGITGHQRELTIPTAEREQKLLAQAKDDLATLRSYSREGLSEDGQQSYAVLDDFLQLAVDGERFTLHDYPITPTSGAHQDLPDFMLNQHPVDSEADAEDYIARLQQFGPYFVALRAQVAERAAKGYLPPRFVAEKVTDTMRKFASHTPANNPLVVEFAKKLDKIQLDAGRRKALLAEAESAVAKVVVPSYQALIADFDALLPRLTHNHGVWALPEGAAYYAHSIRRHTRSTMTAEQIHQLGLREVARIEAEMDRLLRMGGLSEGSIGERMEQLAAQPTQQYPDNAEGRAQVIADYQKIIDEVQAGIKGVFGKQPKQGVKVEPVPTFMQDTATGAYYQPGALDGSRPGVFYANLRSLKEIPRFGMRTLAYHEAIPGHHFQITLAQENTELPFFRRLLGDTAYIEGWALYAERLAWEQGFEPDIPSNLGRLQAEMFRAVRLVVDTGLHAKRWTREEAISYMRSKTGQGELDVTAEIERYLVWPGQALAYKLGMLKILELRESAKTQLGAKFDIRRFHTVVLTGGALPMPLLEQRVKAWIDRGGA